MEVWKNEGRIAGLWYLAVIVFGIGAEVIRSAIPEPIAHEALFRVGLVGDIVMMVSFVFLGLAFYRWLADVDRIGARLMVVLVAVSVSINMTNLANHYSALLWLTDPQLAAAAGPQGAAFSLAAERLYRVTYEFANVFFGLWLVPLGLLLFRSGQVPRWLGVLVVIAGVSFLVDTGVKFLAPGLSTWVAPVAAVPSTLGEFGVCLWLLIVGGRPAKTSGRP